VRPPSRLPCLRPRSLTHPLTSRSPVCRRDYDYKKDEHKKEDDKKCAPALAWPLLRYPADPWSPSPPPPPPPGRDDKKDDKQCARLSLFRPFFPLR